MSLKVFSWLLYAAVGAVFVVAATVKIVDPEAFLSSLLTYELFPTRLAVVLTWFAPVLELVVGLCLISGVLRKGAGALTVAMLLVFIGLVVQGLMRGLEMDCGCFGSNALQTSADYYLKIGQNVMLILAVLLAGFFQAQATRGGASSNVKR